MNETTNTGRNQRLSGGDIVRLVDGSVVEIADIHANYIIDPTHTWYPIDSVKEIITKWKDR